MGSETLPYTGSFDELLFKLQELHTSEVSLLREENGRLLAKLAFEANGQHSQKLSRENLENLAEKDLVNLENSLIETTASTTDKDRRVPKSVGPRIDAHAQLRALPDFSSMNGAPDADALAAAFDIAMEETHELEEVMDEIALLAGSDVPVQVAIPSSMYSGLGHECSILPEPSSRDHASPPPSEWWWDPKGSKQAHGGQWPPTGDEGNAEQASESREDTDDSLPRGDAEARRHITAHMNARRGSGTSSLSPQSALGRWEKLIFYAETTRYLESLPTLHTVWRETIDDMNSGEGAGKSVVGLANLKGLVKRGISADSESLQKRVPCSAAIFKQMRPLMMHPTCRRRVCWDMGGIALLLHDLIFIPFQAFETGTGGLGVGYQNFLKVLDLVGATFWTLDIFVSFLTGYYSAEGFVELSPPRVAKHYVRSWFPMDGMIVSVDWGTMLLGMSSASGYMRLGKTVSRIMRVLRLLRFLKMNSTMRELMERINSEYLLQMVSLCKTLIFIVIINHYIACVWYGIGSSGAFNSNWPDKFLVNYPNTFNYAYATSLHWSLTQFTPASMEVVPQNFLERIFTICVIIMALVAFSSFVSSITAAMTHIRQINARQAAEESCIRQFFAEHKVSHGTASRIWHFVRKNKGASGKRMKETDVPALKAIPYKLKEELRLEVYLPLLGPHAFFEEFAMRDKAAALKLCQPPCLMEKTIPVGEELFRGEVEATKMIFVALGTLQYIDNPAEGDFQLDDEELGERVTYVTRGMWACEAALWADHAGLFGPFYAVNGACEVVLIDAGHFHNLCTNSQEAIEFAARYSEAFMTSFRDTCVNAHSGQTEDDDCEEEDSQNWEDAALAKLWQRLTGKTLLFNEVALCRKFTEIAKKAAPSSRESSATVMPFLQRLSHLG